MPKLLALITVSTLALTLTACDLGPPKRCVNSTVIVVNTMLPNGSGEFYHAVRPQTVCTQWEDIE